MAYSPTFFSAMETACKCGCGLSRQIDDRVLRIIDLARAAHGEPIHVTSGWRCAKRNAMVGGAPRSLHLFGCAVDIVSGRMPDLWRLFQRLAQINDIAPAELIRGKKDDYIHIGYRQLVK